MRTVLTLYKTPLLFSVLSIALYASFAYDLQRWDFPKLIGLYAALFLLFYKLVQTTKGSFWFLVSVGIAFRLVFLLALPNLSQDFYRFIWDGRLVLDGLNPYLFTPSELLETPSFLFRNAAENTLGTGISNAETLVAGIGSLSAGHYSNYPPINQLFFALAAWLGGKGLLGPVVVMRMCILLADVGILVLGKKLLEHMKMPPHAIFWYFLNPFIIIELTGNLHFEGVMLSFLILALYLLARAQWALSAIAMGVSVSVKLLPLLLLPLFFQYFKKNINATRFPLGLLAIFYSLVLLTVALSFMPFYSEAFLQNFSSTIALWFQKFEFNASVYYVIRWIGFQATGWNIIETVGKILPVVVLLSILALTFFRKNYGLKALLTAMLWATTVYFLLSTTVHPWYIATPLLLSVFTKYRFPLLWSAVVMLSYSAYGKYGVEENLWVVATEYLIVLGYALWEVTGKRPFSYIARQKSL
jgi:hypothetical protein